MASDNTLGAPTEGLGQTVTFTSPTSQPSQAQGSRRGSLRLGQQGGRANLTANPVAIQDAREGAAVLDVFRKLGDDILAPRIKAARDDAFMTGLQRAAGGEAISEIVNEQPWYSQIFGETPVVEGARAWTASAKAQEEVMRIEADMPNLRTQSPTEVKNLLSQRLANIKTGDRGTDALVVQSLMQELPGLAKRHTKEHIAWQQASYADAFRNRQITAANRLRTTLAAFNPDDSAKPQALLNGKDPGSVTDKLDVTEAQIAFAQSFVKPVDLPQETYDQLTTGTLEWMLSQGNLHAYYSIEDSGLVRDSLSPESQMKLQNAVDRAEADAQRNLPLSVIDEIAKIKALPLALSGPEADAEINKRTKALGTVYRQLTGSRRPPISGTTLIELKNSVIENHIRNETRAREAWDKASSNPRGQEAGEVAAANDAVTMLRTGGSLEGLPAAQVRKAWEVLRADKSPEGLAAMGNARRLAVLQGDWDKAGANRIQVGAKLNLEANSVPGWHKLYLEEWLPLSSPGDRTAAKQYFGEYFNTMLAYSERVAGIDPKSPTREQEATAAFLEAKQPRLPKVGTAKDRVKWAGAVASVAENVLPSGFILGRHNLLPDQASLLGLRTAVIGEEQSDTLSDKERAKLALDQVKMQGVELGGGYWWDSGNQPRLLPALKEYGNKPLPPEHINGAIAATVNGTLKRLDLASKNHTVVYSYMSGSPVLMLMAYPSKGGQQLAVPIRLQDIYDTYHNSRKTAQQKQEEEWLTAPSINDSVPAKVTTAVTKAAVAVKDTKAFPINPAVLRRQEEDERRAAARRKQ